MLKRTFEEMSIDKLEQLIHDSVAEGSCFGGDAVLVMMEVLDEKKRRADCAEAFDVDAMWSRFCADYLPGAESGSIYGDDLVMPAEPPRRRRRGFSVAFRAASIALVLGVLLTAVVSTTAYARGFDLWGVVARWTEEQFGFEREVESLEHLGGGRVADGVYSSIDDALTAYGIDESLMPSLPEDYALSRLTVTETAERLGFIAEYTDAPRVITVSIARHGDGSDAFATHEKDAGEVVIHRAGGIEHYVMTNLDNTIITWINGSFECSVRGEFSVSDAEEMIDSIYERQGR